MINIIIWFFSLVIFSWCYSTLIMCLIFMKKVPKLKISLLIYLIILIILYTVSYFVLSNYFNDILICSLIAFILALIVPKKI